MNVAEALNHKEEAILSLWIERTLDTYTASDFFKNSKDAFANPVGSNIKEGLTQVFRLMVSGADPTHYAQALDQVIRIRAVQDFSPSQAVAPLLELKWIVRQVFSGEQKYRDLLPQLLPFDRDVERVVLQAFDLYMECRDRLYRARIRELKSGSYILTDSGCASAIIKKNLQQIS
jgi:hypothetical protein